MDKSLVGQSDLISLRMQAIAGISVAHDHAEMKIQESRDASAKAKNASPAKEFVPDDLVLVYNHHRVKRPALEDCRKVSWTLHCQGAGRSRLVYVLAELDGSRWGGTLGSDSLVIYRTSLATRIALICIRASVRQRMAKIRLETVLSEKNPPLIVSAQTRCHWLQA